MEHARPGPGEELNPGPETVPRVAATVILLRDGDDGLEVLLAQRNPAARFMGGAWVFPGGAIGPGDGEGERGLRVAAARELLEEVGVALPDPAALVPFSRWITPATVTIRYDTWFFLAIAPADIVPRIDRAEVVDARWFSPARALAASRAGSHPARIPDDQAPRAAVGVRLRRRPRRSRAPAGHRPGCATSRGHR